MNTPLLIWINAYGSWDPELRDPVETIGYNQYLNEVASHLAVLKDRVQAVYLSGGMKDANGQTEAATTIPELEKRLAARGVTLTIQADEQSLTSISIVKKFLQTWQEQYAECHPLLFCDEVRYATNAYVLEQLAQQQGITLPPVNQVLVSIKRLDIHPNSTQEKQQEKLERMRERGIDAVEEEELALRQ